jgi:hypothetical protein
MPTRLSIWQVSSLLALQLAAADFDWQLRPGFPLPVVPPDNPMTAEKVELGRHLFYDQRLSVNGKQSCAGCHRQGLAFTDGLAHAKGTTGAIHPRSSMSLVNVAYAPSLTWANPKLDALEPQALVPMLGTDPVELGLHGLETKVMRKLRSDATYRKLFALAFPGTTPVFREVTMALAALALRRQRCSAGEGKAPPGGLVSGLNGHFGLLLTASTAWAETPEFSRSACWGLKERMQRDPTAKRCGFDDVPAAARPVSFFAA